MKQTVYFPGLNSIRFIAASFVIIAHIEGFKSKTFLPNISRFTEFLGPQGVEIFFTLSGFLITYLCLEEINKMAKVNVLKFYLRRVLRIWPLYFLILTLGYFVLPFTFYPHYFHNPWENNAVVTLLLNVFFLPNVVLALFGSYFTTGVLWSIGVEEQYYLAWPLYINKWRSVKVLAFIFTALVAFKLTVFLFSYYGFNFGSNKMLRAIQVIAGLLKHTSILTGCLFAFVLHRRNKFYLDIIYSNITVAASVILLIISIALSRGPNGSFWMAFDFVNPFCYGVMMLNVINSARALKVLDNVVLNYLGKISYGLYMYHSMTVALSLYLLTPYLKGAGVLPHAALYVLAFSLTIGVAAFSYQFFESPALRLKHRQEIVSSKS